MAGLLCHHDFKKIEVFRRFIEPIDHRRQENYVPVRGRDVSARPADLFFQKLAEIV